MCASVSRTEIRSPAQKQKQKGPSSTTTALRILHPILRLSQILGVFPLQITDDHRLHYEPRSYLTLRALACFCISSVYLLYLCFQFLTCFYYRKSVLQFVVVLCWLISSLNTTLLLALIFAKRADLRFFFDKYNYIKRNYLSEADYAISPSVGTHIRKLYGAYFLLSLLTSTIVALCAVRRPSQNASEFLIMFYIPAVYHSPWLIAAGTLFQLIIVILQTCVFTLIEILCSLFARIFVDTIDKIQKDLKAKIGVCSKGDDMNMPQGQKYGTWEQNLIGIKYVLSAVQKFDCVALEQRLLNEVVGPMLAVYVSLIAFKCCLRIFLLIKYFGLAMATTATAGGEGTRGKEHSESGINDLDYVDMAVFSIHAAIFMIRLTMILFNLGKVYEASIRFDNVISTSLMRVNMQSQRPTSATGSGTSTQNDDQVQNHINLIMAYLATNSANPVSFSALGFFTFSRGTVLGMASIMTTYVVFLLQGV